MMRNLVLLIISIVCLVCAENNQNINISTPLFQNEDTIKYDGPNSSGFGLLNGGTFFAAVRFHPQQSCTLKSIIFFQYQPVVTGCWIYLYEEGQPTYPGVKIDSIFYLGMPGPGGWVRLNFSAPHFRAGGVDFWISIKLTHNQGQIPLGVDAGPSITPAHSFISPDGNIWQTLPAYGQNKNFNIRAIVRYIQPGFDIGIDEILINSLNPPNMMVNLRARIKNYGISFSTNVPVTCSILGPGGVLRYANTLVIASIAPGDTVHFSFGTWTPTIIEEMTIIMRLFIIDEVPANDREVLLIIPLTYFQDFEATNGGYMTTGVWEWGVPTFPPNAHSGIKVWGTGIYPNNCNASLRTYEFVVNDNNPVLKFWHWYDINWGDGGNVKISTNNGVTWTVISPVFGYPGIGWQGSPIPNESCYFATCTTWTEAVFKLPFVSGQRFILRWHFFSDNAQVARGWYIDDVTGIGFIPLPPVTNDVGVETIISPGLTHMVYTPMIPTAQVKNYGASYSNSFSAVCSIIGSNGIVRYTNNQSVPSLAPGEMTNVPFSAWTPTVVELCTVKMQTIHPLDSNPANNQKTRTTQITSSIFIEGFNDSIFPPPGWQSVIIQGTHNWYRDSGQGFVTPYEGLAMASYPAFYAPAGSQARLISPPIFLPYPLNYTIWFYMFHSPEYPGPIGTDSLKVEYSLDGTNFIRVAAFRRYEAITQWTSHSVNLGILSGTIYIGFLAFSQYGNNINIDYVRLNPPGIAEDNINNIPLITMLHSPQPNPITNGIAQISFTLAEPSIVSLKIYDASGRLIKTLANTQLGIGVYSYTWDSKDDNNRKVAEGVYFYTLETPNQKFCRKMVLMQN